jgi:hypothetical protein
VGYDPPAPVGRDDVPEWLTGSVMLRLHVTLE